MLYISSYSELQAKFGQYDKSCLLYKSLFERGCALGYLNSTDVNEVRDILGKNVVTRISSLLNINKRQMMNGVKDCQTSDY